MKTISFCMYIQACRLGRGCSLLLFCFFSFGNAVGQVFFHDEAPYRQDSEIDSLRNAFYPLIDSLTATLEPLRKGDLFELAGNIIFIPDGYFDVYLYQHKGWANQYKGIFGEYNFGSAKFVINDTLYSVGGEGYWTKNQAIIAFLGDKGGWELLKFSEDLPHGIPYQTKDGICIANAGALATVDLQTGKYSLGKNEDQWLPKHVQYFLENDAWLVCRDSLYLYFRDKATGEVYSMLGGTTPFFNLSSTDFVHVRHDSVVVHTREGIRQSFSIRPSLKTASLMQDAAFHYTKPLSVCAFCMLAAGLFIYRKKALRTIQNKSQLLEARVQGTTMAAILPYRGKTLDLAQMDALLGIDGEINGDAKKYKRAQIIREMNEIYQAETGKSLIERERDAADGRKYVYNIIG
jgi:hypothetical protein